MIVSKSFCAAPWLRLSCFWQLAFWLDMVSFHVIICRSNARLSSVSPPHAAGFLIVNIQHVQTIHQWKVNLSRMMYTYLFFFLEITIMTCFVVQSPIIDGLEWCGLLWFLSAVWNLILTAPIHCKGTTCEVMLNFSRSFQMKKQTHLHLGWPEGE